MAEPQKMVHLTPWQRRRKWINHPLTDKAPPVLTEKRLNQLLLDYFETDEEGEFHIEIGKELIASHLRLLRYTVAQYLYYWPITRRFFNEMISSGTEAIAKIIVKLKPEQLKKENNFKSLGGLIENAIRQSIETTINNLRGIAPASERTNRDRESKDKEPIYGNVETDLTSDDIKDSKTYNDLGSLIFEVKDAIEVIARTQFEKQILAQENWGLSNIELGKKLNTSPQHVGRVKSHLYASYKELGEKYA